MTFNKKVVYVLLIMLALFCAVVLYFSYFQIFQSEEISQKSGNRRLESIQRGSIYDRHGELLAESEVSENGQARSYPHGTLYSQLIGYCSPVYDRSLLEASFSQYLQGDGIGDSFLETLFGIDPSRGADLHLTVDHDLQKRAYSLLNGRKGAVVALDPATGEVLCMASNPTYNPNTLEENFDSLEESDGEIWLPRATSIDYVPGSVFKIITAAAAVENGLDTLEYMDEGTFVVNGQEIHNYGNKVYGELDLKTAFAKSSNTYFAYLATELGADALLETANRFGFNADFPFCLPHFRSTTLSGEISDTQLAAVGYGQGDTLTTPLHMAMITAAIANDGQMMAPYVVSRAARDGKLLYEKKSSVLRRAVSATTAQTVGDFMVECVESGTGTGAAISGMEVAAKTGTAEVENKADHAWFVAYAPANNPEIALAIVLENAGTTGSACAPMARNLILEYLQ
ncbi:MAG: penicillin-binding protein 2 [Clostridia bacterium]|nr:penicillin-binding protein 2 [Clostridia bacterium]